MTKNSTYYTKTTHGVDENKSFLLSQTWKGSECVCCLLFVL